MENFKNRLSGAADTAREVLGAAKEIADDVRGHAEALGTALEGHLSVSAATRRAEEVDEWFKHHPPTTPEVTNAHEHLRKGGKALAESILLHTPQCREQSLALTKLREAVMWANAAVAIHQKTGMQQAQEDAARTPVDPAQESADLVERVKPRR